MPSRCRSNCFTFLTVVKHSFVLVDVIEGNLRIKMKVTDED